MSTPIEANQRQIHDERVTDIIGGFYDFVPKYLLGNVGANERVLSLSGRKGYEKLRLDTESKTID
jgi:hypothetical protein